MFKVKIFISILIFSSLLIITSAIKNQTRVFEKKILNISKKISLKEKDINETQLDFTYLTSPNIIEKKIEQLNSGMYSPMEYSKIFPSIQNFLNIEKKLVIKKKYR